MNRKFILLFLVAVVLAAVVLVKLPSKADTQVQSSPKSDSSVFAPEKVVEYSNETLKIEPQNFAVSKSVKDMSTEDPDGFLKSALYETKQQKEEARKEALRKQGLSEEQIKEDEVNRLNTKRLKKLVPGAGADKGDGRFEDLLVEKKSSAAINAPQAMPTPSFSFNGATQADNLALGIGAKLPPDPNGDVGPNHYVSSVNLVLKMFDKNGTIVAGPIKTSDLFGTLPAGDPCRVQNNGDPIVLYDTLADRWHISQFGLPTGNVKYQCVALSVTGDPTGAYYVWSYAYANSVFNDYPKVGVWTDAYHMTFNQFATSNSAFLGLGLLSQDRRKALVGDPNTAFVYRNVGAIDLDSGGALPGDIDGYVAPPEGMAEVIGEFQADEYYDPVDGLRFYKWQPDFSNPDNSRMTILPDLPMAPFDARDPAGLKDIEQQGGQNLDAVSDRSMHRLAYRNFGTTANPINSYAGNFTVNVSGVRPDDAASYQAGIRWFELRRVNDTFSLYDEGTHNLTPGNGANGLNNWMSSVAQDNRGDIAVGFSQSGTSQNADIKIAGRTNNVPNSGTLNEGEALFHDATGSQTSTGSRWGDYSSMSIDPSDDCTFWYTQEYYATTSQADWLTRVGKFKFPQCTPAPKATITGTITFCDGGAPINQASVDGTGGFNRVTGANGTYSMTVSPGTYTIVASKVGGFVGSARTVTVGAGQTGTANICLTGTAFVAQSGDIQVISENCGAPNGAVDPGETITVSLPLQNIGAAGTTNLTATLQGTGGVINPGAAQSYGALSPGMAGTVRNFTFKADPNLPCGSEITLTFTLSDGATSYGTITKTYTTGAKTILLNENFDGVTAPALPAGWSSVAIVGANNWVTSTVSPASPPNMASAGASGAVSSTALVSPVVAIQGTNAQISFKNFYSTENEFDGMVLEYTNNGGASWTDVIAGGGSFASSGYNETISTGYSSPIAGRMAWSGESGGYANTVVNLPAALNGQSVQFRWVIATDTSIGGVGVRIDDVQVLGARVCNTACSGTANCNLKRRFDFAGDSRADISVFRPSDGYWYLLDSQGAASATRFGAQNDTIVPADYDGDNKTDLAVYRSGIWYLQRSTEGFTGLTFGEATDIPQPADFTGDGKAELAVFRPSNGTWYIYNLANNQVSYILFGQNGDKPVVGDYDGDCKADAAVYRNGIWYLQRSTTGFTAIQFGDANDKLVPADYDGDGKTDVAVFRPSDGNWFILQSQLGFTGILFGQNGDKPVPADYDADGKADVAVFRNGTWYLQRSTAGFFGVVFGDANDKPVPNAFVR